MDRKRRGAIIAVLMVGITFACILIWKALKPKLAEPSQTANTLKMALPTPRYDSNFSIEEALLKRRSIREYTDEPLMLQQVSQLLWAAQGITDPRLQNRSLRPLVSVKNLHEFMLMRSVFINPFSKVFYISDYHINFKWIESSGRASHSRSRPDLGQRGRNKHCDYGGL